MENKMKAEKPKTFRFQIRTCSYAVVEAETMEEARMSVVENVQEYIEDNDPEISEGEEW
jgi:hypothetical protein